MFLGRVPFVDVSSVSQRCFFSVPLMRLSVKVMPAMTSH